MNGSPPTLSALPAELLLQILTHLPPSSRVSLSLVSKHFHHWTSPKHPSTLSTYPNTRCENLAITRYLTSHLLHRLNKRRCLLCGAVQSTTFFRSAVTPICKWHDGWFMALHPPPALESRIRGAVVWLARRGRTCWVALTRKYCVHEREVVGWFVEDCGCGCGSCGHFDVVCYVRAAAEGERPRSWRIRDVDGGERVVVVEERVWSGGFREQELESCSGLDSVQDGLLRTHSVEVPVIRFEDLQAVAKSEN